MEKNAEKRPAEEHKSLLHDAKAIVTEVEGTTTPLSFVKVCFMAKCFSSVEVALPAKMSASLRHFHWLCNRK